MQTTIDLKEVELIIFGDFNVLTTAPFRNNGKLEILTGRLPYLASLREDRERRGVPMIRYAITANKGGVAYGLQTEEQALAEVQWTAEQIQTPFYVLCFGHPTPAAGLERYASPELLANRKPAPGMLEMILVQTGIAREKTLVVGTYSDDCKAAIAAGLAWQTTNTFFREAERKALTQETFGGDELGLQFLDVEVEE